MRSSYNPSMILTNAAQKQQGFTLIEMVIGIVTLALVLPMVATLLFPVMEQSFKNIHTIRAAELGQSIMNEIVDKAFDENSDMAGGKIRCGEQILGVESISCSAILGRDGNEVFENFDVVSDDPVQATDKIDYAFDNFDDVDDYHGVNKNTTRELYIGFNVEVSVCNDSNYDGVCSGDTAIDNIHTAKLISIAITDPSGSTINFATYRTNY